MTDARRVRVSMLGVVVVVLFCTLMARLWFLQAGLGGQLPAPAVNTIRVLQTQTPRGEILDRNGVVLVRDRASWTITVDRDLASRARDRVLGQLAELLAVPAQQLRAQYESPRQSPLEPAVVAIDVAQPRRLAILQDPQDYPGVHVVELPVRAYPHGDLAAQALGYVGEIPAGQLVRARDLGYQPGDQIGLAGAEAAFEPALRGRPRRETVAVDPTGRQAGGPLAVDPGSVGDTVYLTIDAEVQAAAEQSLAQGMASARTRPNANANVAPAGSVIVLNARDGSVVAIASNPTYNPAVWVGGIRAPAYAALTSSASGEPLLNRATQGLYAPGSTFKLVTSLAMVQTGIRDPSFVFDDTGSATISGRTFTNANGGEAFGPVDLQHALTVSSDAYFYTVGDAFWQRWNYGPDQATGLGIQRVARELGFGAATGFELDEARGRVPGPAWKQAFADANYKSAELRRENGAWEPGDNVNVAVGQGDLVVTPLQLANAYAAFANGGTLWQPHLEAKVVTPTGSVVETVEPHALRTFAIDPGLRATMLAGFEGAVDSASPQGTAYQAFTGFPFGQVAVAGKTGTAQVTGKGDTSLFVGMFPAGDPEYVVVAVVEQAGFGAQTAAPIVRRIIESMNGLPAPAVNANGPGHD
jgi:penicillin-binding protein 2